MRDAINSVLDGCGVLGKVRLVLLGPTPLTCEFVLPRVNSSAGEWNRRWRHRARGARTCRGRCESRLWRRSD
eukprot:811777-Prorocentrum_minimum.AAC.1